MDFEGKPFEQLESLIKEEVFKDSKIGMEALEEFKLLFTYLESLDALANIEFDLSLARGLDYYTGIFSFFIIF